MLALLNLSSLIWSFRSELIECQRNTPESSNTFNLHEHNHFGISPENGIGELSSIPNTPKKKIG